MESHNKNTESNKAWISQHAIEILIIFHEYIFTNPLAFIYYPEQADCDTYDTILFPESYPWELNKIERNLTENKLETICCEYMIELDIKDNPDYQALEYYGWLAIVFTIKRSWPNEIHIRIKK